MIEGIIYKLINDSVLSAEIGYNKAGNTVKVYPVVCPQGEEMPYVVCALTGADSIECKGSTGQPTDESFDILTYAEGYKKADTIGRMIIGLLNGFSGTVDSVDFTNIVFVNHLDLFDNERQAYVRRTTFKATGYF